MIRSLLLALALLAAPLVARAHPPAQLNADAERVIAEEVRAFRKALAAAIAAKDVVRLRRMYADGFVHTHGSGKLDGKDARIVAALAGDPILETAPADEVVIRIPGGWTAVATGLSPVRSQADSKTYAFRWTAVYVRMGESWQLVASHATRLNEIKP